MAGGTDFMAYDSATGAILWQFSSVGDNSAVYTPTVVDTMAVDDQGRVFWCDNSRGELAYVDVMTGEILGWTPTPGFCGKVSLLGMDTGWYAPTSDLRGYILTKSSSNRTLMAFVTPTGPAAGPWCQWGGTPFHQSRRDDAPDLYMTSPVDGTVITGAFTAIGQASDDFRLQNMCVYLNNTRMYKTSGGYVAWGADSGLFEDGEYAVSVVARDSGGNRAISQATVLFINPPPVYGVSSGPPIFSWLSNGYDNKYQVNISMDPNFTSILASSANQTQEYRKSTSWQPSVKKWKKVTDAALLSPTIQTTFYWRVIGKTGGQAVRRTFILDKTR